MSEGETYIPPPRAGQGSFVAVLVAAVLLLALLAVLVFGGLLYLRFSHSAELQRALEAEQQARAQAEQARAVAEQARREAEAARQAARSGEPADNAIQANP